MCRPAGAAGLRWGFKIHKGYITRRSGCSDEYLHAKGLYVRVLYVISRNNIARVFGVYIYLSFHRPLSMYVSISMYAPFDNINLSVYLWLSIKRYIDS